MQYRKFPYVNIIAGLLLSLMFFTAFFSVLNDSFTFDETAHIAAGYSYLTQRDYRMNPEHPPLIKDLAALPLLFLNLNFPKDSPAWQQKEPIKWWFQFDFATDFLYKSGNNPDKILIFSKLPMIFLLVFLGWFLFWWAKREFGSKIGLFVLFLFSFSPNFLAHGRFVTTDVAASLGVVLATFFWLKFLKNPSKKNIIFAGLILGAVMLFKFSLILLLPFLGIITLVYVVLNKKNVLRYLINSAAAGLIGLVFVIWPVYQFHVSNYPAEKQVSDTIVTLENSPFGSLKNPVIWIADKPILRPISQYLLGVLMASQRTTSGNTTYFMNRLFAGGSPYYFPVVYFFKNPLALHFLSLMALILWLIFFKKSKSWLSAHFTEFSMIVFLLIYWTTSVAGNLNIGVRHILPTFPFIFILIGLGIFKGLEQIKKPVFKKVCFSFVFIMLAWYGVSSAKVYPSFLAYYNEAAGGPKNGYKIAVDSNYDWGQDLKRLASWVKKNNIDKIYLDYFGGGNAEYYLGEKFSPWQGQRNPSELTQGLPAGRQGNYLAVSATMLQGGRGRPAAGFNEPTGFYNWLNKYELVAQIGNSIFVYKIEETNISSPDSAKLRQ